MSSNRLPARVTLVEVGPRDGLQNEKAPVASRGQDRTGAPAAGRRPARDRGHQLRQPEVGAADGRQRAGDGRHRAPARRALFGADAEPEGLRGRARRPAGRDRGLRRRQRGLQPEEHQLLDRRDRSSASHRWSRPRARAGIKVRGAISCAVGCPYEGEIAPERVGMVARLMKEIGVASRGRGRHDRRRHAAQGAGRARGGACALSARRGQRAFPRHLWPGAGQRLRQPGGRHLDLRRQRLPASAAARTPRARPAMSRPKTWSSCCTAWASRPASTSTG